MKNLGPTKRIPEIEITRDRSNRKLYLSLKDFIEKVLNWYRVNNVKPMSTLFVAKFRLSRYLSLKTEKKISYML